MLGVREVVSVITVVGLAVLVSGSSSFDDEPPSPDKDPFDVQPFFWKGSSPPRRDKRDADKTCEVSNTDSLNEIVGKCMDATIIKADTQSTSPVKLDLSEATEEQVKQILSKVTAIYVPLVFQGSATVKQLNLAKLDQPSDLIIVDNTILESIELPAVTTLEFEVKIENNPSLTEIKFSALTGLGTKKGGFVIKNNAMLPEINFPSLTSIDMKEGGLEIKNNPILAKIDLSKLISVQIQQGGLEIKENAKLATISFPELSKVFIQQGGLEINENQELMQINLGTKYRQSDHFKLGAGLVIRGNRRLEDLVMRFRSGIMEDSVQVTVKDNRMLTESALNDFKQLKSDTAVWDIQEPGECTFPNEVNDFGELDNCLYVDGNLALAANIQGDLAKPLQKVTGDVVIVGSNFTDLDFLENTTVNGNLELKNNALLCWMTADNITSLFSVQGTIDLQNPPCPTTTTTTTTTTTPNTTVAETTEAETTETTTEEPRVVIEEETSEMTETVTEPAVVDPGSRQRVGAHATTEESSNMAAVIGGSVGGGIAVLCLIGAAVGGVIVFMLYKKGRLFRKKKKEKPKKAPKKKIAHVKRKLTKEQRMKLWVLAGKVKHARIKKLRRKQKKQLKKKGPAKGFKFPPKLRHTVNRFKYKKGQYQHMPQLQKLFAKLLDTKIDKIQDRFIRRRRKLVLRPYEAPAITKKTVKVDPMWWGPEPKEESPQNFHATYIGSKTLKKRFIMCKTPNRLTDYDFWSMIIEKKVQAIVGFVAKPDFDSPAHTLGTDSIRYYAYKTKIRHRRVTPIQTGGSKLIQIKCLRRAYLPPESWRKPKIMRLYTDRVTLSKKSKRYEDRHKRRLLWPIPVRRYKDGQQDFRHPQTGLVYLHAAQCVRVHKLRVYVKEFGIKRTIFHFEMCGWRMNSMPNMRRLFKLVNSINKFGGTVVVHSPSGNGRAPTFCAIALMAKQLLMNKPMSDPVKLVNKIAKRCPGVLLRSKIVFICICAIYYMTLKMCRKRFAAAHPDRKKAKGKWKICRARIHNDTHF